MVRALGSGVRIGNSSGITSSNGDPRSSAGSSVGDGSGSSGIGKDDSEDEGVGVGETISDGSGVGSGVGVGSGLSVGSGVDVGVDSGVGVGVGSGGHAEAKGITDPSQHGCISTGSPPSTVKASEMVTTSVLGANLTPRLKFAGSQPVDSTTPDQDGYVEMSTVNLMWVNSPVDCGYGRTSQRIQSPVLLTP